MRSPISFFDTNPTGRILNRFSVDTDEVDGEIPFQLSDFAWSTVEMLGIFFVICYSTPAFSSIILPLAVIYYLLQKYFIASSRQMKARWESDL